MTPDDVTPDDVTPDDVTPDDVATAPPSPAMQELLEAEHVSGSRVNVVCETGRVTDCHESTCVVDEGRVEAVADAGGTHEHAAVANASSTTPEGWQREQGEAIPRLAALAAAAGGQARSQDTARRFLAPLGSVKIGEQADEPRPATPRFRSTVLDDDKLRPAWERKYVD